MPGQRVQSQMWKKYGNSLDNAVKKHASDETKYGFIALPGGITNGVAQLSKAYFAQYKKGDGLIGEYYFRAEGIVQEPSHITTPDGVISVQGLTTSIQVPVCQTKKANGDVITQEENVEKILNEMRKLAGEDFTRDASGADLESLAEQLEQLQPYFRFSTQNAKNTKPGETPRVWENWHGCKGLDNYTPEVVNGMADNSESVTQTSRAQAPAASPPANGTPATTRRGRPPKAKEPEVKQQDANQFSEFGDLASLAAQADDPSEDPDVRDSAIQQLTDMAVKAGVDEDAIGKAPSWQAVADMIEQSGGNGEEEASPEPEEGDELKVNSVRNYKPWDKRTKKFSTKPVEVLVVKLFPKAQTATVKNLINEEVYTDVPYSQLLP